MATKLRLPWVHPKTPEELDKYLHGRTIELLCGCKATLNCHYCCGHYTCQAPMEHLNKRFMLFVSYGWYPCPEHKNKPKPHVATAEILTKGFPEKVDPNEKPPPCPRALRGEDGCPLHPVRSLRSA